MHAGQNVSSYYVHLQIPRTSSVEVDFKLHSIQGRWNQHHLIIRFLCYRFIQTSESSGLVPECEINISNRNMNYSAARDQFLFSRVNNIVVSWIIKRIVLLWIVSRLDMRRRNSDRRYSSDNHRIIHLTSSCAGIYKLKKSVFYDWKM